MFSLIPWKHGEMKSRSSLAVNDSLESRVTRFRDEFNSLIDKFWSHDLSDTFGNITWGVELDEDEKEYVVRAEAPGFEAEDFDVQVRGNNLVIRAEHQEEEKNGKSGSRYHYGRYERSLPLPAGAETDNITARYHSGVLELHVPKGEEAQGRRIAVKAK